MLVQNPVRITHKQLHIMGCEAKGSVTKIYLHWTAGHYGQAYSDYHINIDRDGEIYQTCQTLFQHKDHTYMRNKGSIGIALCCGVDAVCQKNGRIDFGKEPPTPVQIEKLAQVIAILAHALELEINFSTVTTHAEAAFMDGYGPGSNKEIRWDLWYLPDLPQNRNLRPGGVLLRQKAAWYYDYYFKSEMAAVFKARQETLVA